MNYEIIHLPQGVVLGYGDVIRQAYGFDRIGKPAWENEVLVIDGMSANAGTTYVGVGRSAVRKQDQQGNWLPQLNWAGTERPVAVQVFGTLSLNEMRELVGRGWEEKHREIALRALCPDSQQREPHYFSFIAQLVGVDNPGLYIP